MSEHLRLAWRKLSMRRGEAEAAYQQKTLVFDRGGRKERWIVWDVIESGQRFCTIRGMKVKADGVPIGDGELREFTFAHSSVSEII